jgi:trk system potassium uptake protein TrkH
MHGSERPARRSDHLRRRIIFIATVLAAASLVAEYGFYLDRAQEAVVRVVNLGIVAMFLVEMVLSLFSVPNFRRALLRATPLFVIALLFGLQILFVRFYLSHHPVESTRLLSLLRVSTLTRLYFLIVQGYILVTLGFHAQRLSQRLAYLRLRPAQLLMGAFLFFIITGTLLLMLPKAVAPGRSLDLTDALFTATSAVCVTGLIVVDTATHFSKTGQIIIMMLIQVGGLGIMTFAAFFALLAGRGLGIKERIVMREVMNVEFLSSVSNLVLSILAITFLIEAAGTVLLFFLLPSGDFSWLGRLFNALFHSVSAFCNAGFSVYSSGLEPFYSDVGITLVFASLIIIGGLGFTVHQDLLGGLIAKIRKRRRPVKLRIQTKAVLAMSGVLIVMGTAIYYFFDHDHISFLQAFFQSVTPRTAGFDTTVQNSLSEESQFLTMLLMFIGAAPGSTGGGIKVTTVAIILATVFSTLRGRESTELFRKTLPAGRVRESIVIATLSVFAISVAVMILLTTETGAFRSILFEIVSAFGTVGLSLGQTAALTTIGKVVITALMFFGRVGPMAIALAMTGRPQSAGYSYPTENVMVG